MNTSTRKTTLSLATSALLVAMTAAAARSATTHYNTAHADTIPTVEMSTITITASDEDRRAAFTAPIAMPTLPTVVVRASEAEKLAAQLDSADRIAVLSTITVTANAEDIASATLANANAAFSSSDDQARSILDTVLDQAAAAQPRLRLDMPYYSLGKVLTHARPGN